MLLPIDKITLMLKHLLMKGACRSALQFLGHLGLFIGCFLFHLVLFRGLGLILSPCLRMRCFIGRIFRYYLLSSNSFLVKLVINLSARLLQSNHILFILDSYQRFFKALAILVQLLLLLIVQFLKLISSNHLDIFYSQVVTIGMKDYVFFLH